MLAKSTSSASHDWGADDGIDVIQVSSTVLIKCICFIYGLCTARLRRNIVAILIGNPTTYARVQEMTVLRRWYLLSVIITSSPTTLSPHVDLILVDRPICIHHWVWNIWFDTTNHLAAISSSGARYHRALLSKLLILTWKLLLILQTLLLNQWQIPFPYDSTSCCVSRYLGIVFQLSILFQNVLSIFHYDILLLTIVLALILRSVSILFLLCLIHLLLWNSSVSWSLALGHVV